MYRLMMESEKYNLRDKQYGLVFRRCNTNLFKRHKNQQREEPAVLDVINKMALVKSSMECYLSLC